VPEGREPLDHDVPVRALAWPGLALRLLGPVSRGGTGDSRRLAAVRPRGPIRPDPGEPLAGDDRDRPLRRVRLAPLLLSPAQGRVLQPYPFFWKGGPMTPVLMAEIS